MRICLERHIEEAKQTLGRLYVYDENHLALWLHILELPWRNNERRISRIPTGTYPAIKHVSPRFGECVWIQDVPDRSEILIHAGNFHRDTLGCPLPGTALLDIDGDGYRDVINSRVAMRKLMRIVPLQFEVEVIDAIKNK